MNARSVAQHLLTVDSVLRTAPSALACALTDELVILDQAKGIYYSLDPIGSRIWSLLATPRTICEVCADLCAEYDVSAEQCATDVVALASQLVSLGLVEHLRLAQQGQVHA